MLGDGCKRGASVKPEWLGIGDALLIDLLPDKLCGCLLRFFLALKPLEVCWIRHHAALALLGSELGGRKPALAFLTVYLSD